MKFFLSLNFKRTKKNADCDEMFSPQATLRPRVGTSIKQEGYSLPVDITVPPLHTMPPLKQPTIRSEFRPSRTQSPAEIDASANDVLLSPKMVKNAVSYLDTKNKALQSCSCQPSDSDLFNRRTIGSPYRDLLPAHVHTPSLSNKTGSPRSNPTGSPANRTIADGIRALLSHVGPEYVSQLLRLR